MKTDISVKKVSITITPHKNRVPLKFGHANNFGGGVSDPSAISYVPHQRLFEAFVKSLEDGTEPEFGGESASKSVEIICAAYESARTGKAVNLS